MAGIAGILWGLLFRSVVATTGFLPGIKAFTAAVLGGVGNLGGAMAGGVSLGAAESVGPLVLLEPLGIPGVSQLKDAVAFVLLIAVLLFKPSGLFGERLSAEDRGMTATSVPVAASSSETRWSPDLWRLVSYGAICALVHGLHLSHRHAREARPAAAHRSDPQSRLRRLCVWVPVVFGYSVTSFVVLEGMAARRRGLGDVRRREPSSGAWAGSVSGILGLLVDNFDLRDPLVNWSPQLVDFITFSNSIGFGIVIWLVIGALCGAAGAGLHLLPDTVRLYVASVVLAVVGMSFLETAATDLLQGLKLEFISDAIYAKQGGLTVSGAVIVAVLTVVGLTIARFIRANQRKATTGRAEADLAAGGGSSLTPVGGAMRRRSNRELVLGGLGIIALLLLPQVLGGIMNELLANVGLFLLLALGLNIVVGLAGILDLGYVAFFAVGGYTTAVLTSPNRAVAASRAAVVRGPRAS